MRNTLFFLLTLFLLGCSSTSDSRTQLKFLDNEALIGQSAEAFTQMKQQIPIAGPRQTQYVQCVADALTPLVSPETFNGEWEVVVFDSEQINAFAMPGGKIGIFTGILAVTETPDQLAAIIGHEIAHVIKEHANERASQKMLAKGASIIGKVLMDLNNVDAGTQNLAMNGIGLLSQYGVLMPYSRLHESEADIAGLELLIQAGYSPYAAVELWQNMDKASAGKAKPPEILSTHPSADTRIKDLKNAIKAAVKKHPVPNKVPTCRI